MIGWLTSQRSQSCGYHSYHGYRTVSIYRLLCPPYCEVPICSDWWTQPFTFERSTRTLSRTFVYSPCRWSHGVWCPRGVDVIVARVLVSVCGISCSCGWILLNFRRRLTRGQATVSTFLSRCRLISDFNPGIRFINIPSCCSDIYCTCCYMFFSDVKRGQNLEAEARATRPRLRPISGGWGPGRGQK